jgi:hypothetical protein
MSWAPGGSDEEVGLAPVTVVQVNSRGARIRVPDAGDSRMATGAVEGCPRTARRSRLVRVEQERQASRQRRVLGLLSLAAVDDILAPTRFRSMPVVGLRVRHWPGRSDSPHVPDPLPVK